VRPRTEKYRGNVFLKEEDKTLNELLHSLGITRDDVEITEKEIKDGCTSFSFMYDGTFYYRVYEKKG